MGKIPGITKEKDYKGSVRYIRIDMRKHGDNELLQDFLDLLDANERQDEAVVDWKDVKKELDKKHAIKE